MIDNTENTVVVSLLVDISGNASVKAFDQVISHIHGIETPGSIVEVPDLDLGGIAQVVNAISFFHYTGSLTTPPCTEGVEFFVSTQTLPLHIEQFNRLKAVVGHNARFVQGMIPKTENVLVTSRNSLKYI